MNRKRADCNLRVLCSVVGLANMTFSVIKEIKAKRKKKHVSSFIFSLNTSRFSVC